MDPSGSLRQRHYPDLGVTVVQSGSLLHEFPPHRHHSVVLGQVLSGRRRVIYPDGAVELEPGQIYAILPGEVHACQALSPDSQGYRALCVDGPPASPLHKAKTGESPTRFSWVLILEKP